jgi:hypothetical protein
MAKMLCECKAGQFQGEPIDEQFAAFDALARQCGYASGIAAANECVLWGDTVEQAVAFMSKQLEVSDGRNE